MPSRLRPGRTRRAIARTGTLAVVFAVAVVGSAVQAAGALAATDLVIPLVEKTQVIQNLHNTIPMVYGKPLVLRAYVDATAGGSNGPGPNGFWTVGAAQADIYDRSFNYLGTVFPTSSTIQVAPTPTGVTSYRNDPSRTFNFLIPASMERTDGIYAYVFVNVDRGVPETNYGNSSHAMFIPFVRTRDLNVKGDLYISPAHPYSNSAYNDFYTQIGWVGKVWPVAHARIYGYGGYQIWTDPTGDPTDAYFPGADKVIARANGTRQLSSTYSNMVWYVLQQWNTCACGYAYLSTTPTAATGQDNTGPLLGTVMAQELAHAYFALKHTGHTTANADPNCCPGGEVNALDSTSLGWDVDTMAPVLPGSAPHVHDFQSYGGPPIWVSDYTYLNLLHGLQLKASADTARKPARPAAVANRPYLLLTGTMSQLRGTLDEAYVIDKPAGSDDGPGTGPYSLTFKDMGGNVLFTRHFDSYSPDTDQPLSFSQMVPYDPRIASIVLSSNTVPLATRTRSPNAPAIQILTPQAGVHWDGARHVTWQASDADGDPLHYAVQYSSDGGNTWLTLSTGLEQPSFDVDAATLQGSRDCRIRVIASDGLNSTTAESGQFGVNPHAPSARIISAHVDGHTGAVTLVGSGYDADDGPLPDARLSWRASRDGQLGTGPTLVTRPLSSGRHVITLTVVDRDGNRASATLVVRLRRNPVPSAPRRLRSRVRRGRVHLRWHRAHGARTYVVQSASLHGVPRFVTIAMLGRRARSFTVGAGGNHHRYRVEACNRAGCTPSTPLTAGR